MPFDLVRTVTVRLPLNLNAKQAAPVYTDAWFKSRFENLGYEVIDVCVSIKKHFAWIKFKEASQAHDATNRGQIMTKDGRFMKVHLRNYLNDEKIRMFTCGRLEDEEIIDCLLDCNDFEQQIIKLKEMILISEDDFERRKSLCQYLEEMIRQSKILDDARLLMYGSSSSGIGFRDADIDAFLESKKLANWKKELSPKIALKKLQEIKKMIKDRLHIWSTVIESVRCPIIKIEFNKEFELKDTGISIDINLTNPWGVLNTKLLKFLCDFEPRFQSLAVVLRFWAKKNGFISSNFFSSYAFSILVIFFCQNINPPLLSTIELLQSLANDRLILVGQVDCSFCDDPRLLSQHFQSNNQCSSVFTLAQQFFQFYSHFPYSEYLISIRKGQPIAKNPIISNNSMPTFDPAHKIWLQDPFELNMNLARRLTPNQFVEFFHAIKASSEKIDMIQKEGRPGSFSSSNKASLSKGGNQKKLWGLAKLLFESSLYSRSDNTNSKKKRKLTNNQYQSAQEYYHFLEKCEFNEDQAIEMWADALIEATKVALEKIIVCDSYRLNGRWDVIARQENTMAEFECKIETETFKYLLYRDTVRQKYSALIDTKSTYLEKEIVITDIIQAEVKSDFDQMMDLVNFGRPPGKIDPKTFFQPFEAKFTLILDLTTTVPSFDVFYIKTKGTDFGFKKLLKTSIQNLSVEVIVPLSKGTKNSRPVNPKDLIASASVTS